MRAPGSSTFGWKTLFALIELVFIFVGHQALATVPLSHQACLASLAAVQAPAAVLESYRVDSETRVAFLREILEIREPLVRRDLLQNERLSSCLAADPSGRRCPEAISLLTTLRERAAMARLSLGAAQSPYQSATWRGEAIRLPNTTLDALGSFKIRRWQPLTTSERAIVEEALSVITRDLLTSHPGADPEQEMIRRRSLISQRMAYFIDYATLMSQNPLLQWVSSATPSVAEFVSALREAASLSRRDLASIAEQRAAIHFHRGLAEARPQINDPILYSPIVRQIAGRNVESCLVALKLRIEYQTVQFQDSLVLMFGGLPFMFVGGPVGWAAMITIGGAAIGQSQMQLMSVESRELGVAIDWASADLPALRTAVRDRNAMAVSVVIALPILRGGRMAFRATTESLRNIARYRQLLRSGTAR